MHIFIQSCIYVLLKMLSIFHFIRLSRVLQKWFSHPKFQNLQESKVVHTLQYPIVTKNSVDLQAWLLLIAPLSAFVLGTWQLQLKIQKDNVISALKSHTSATPADLPENLEEIDKLEYYPIRVSGQYLHDKEMYIGPRSLVKQEGPDDSSIFTTTNTSGYLVVTPLKLLNKNQIILVNRGWVPRTKKDPQTRLKGQPDGSVDVTGIVRVHEKRPAFVPENRPDTNTWFYRDLNQMCALTGASPVFLDATDESSALDGPVGGQTIVHLKNDHLLYSVQAYSLSVVMSYMWYKQFIKRMRL